MRYPCVSATSCCGTDVPVVPSSASGITARLGRFRRSLVRPLHLTSVLLSIFMVAALPACFYGSLLRAGVAASNNANNNEEHRHEEHREQEDGVEGLETVTPRARMPVAPRRPAPLAHRWIQPVAIPRLVDPYIPHPSRFSERRLI